MGPGYCCLAMQKQKKVGKRGQQVFVNLAVDPTVLFSVAEARSCHLPPGDLRSVGKTCMGCYCFFGGGSQVAVCLLVIRSRSTTKA